MLKPSRLPLIDCDARFAPRHGRNPFNVDLGTFQGANVRRARILALVAACLIAATVAAAAVLAASALARANDAALDRMERAGPPRPIVRYCFVDELQLAMPCRYSRREIAV